MKTLVVPFISIEGSGGDSAALRIIDIEPWSGKSQPACDASFSISHFNQGICLRYTIKEPFLSARKRNINGEVHRDNCVEFFIAFGDDSNYYNFEFNCLGCIKAAFGKDRNNRCLLPPEGLAKLYDSMEIFIDFLSWVALKSAKPDFHQPLSFGKIIFEKHHEII